MDRTSPLAIVITTALPLLPVVLLQSLHDAVVQGSLEHTGVSNVTV